MLASLRDAILNRDGSACRYCGGYANHIDHVLPASRGGADHPDNRVAACVDCNMEKLDYTVEEWQAYRRRFGLPWPPESRSAFMLRIAREMGALPSQRAQRAS